MTVASSFVHFRTFHIDILLYLLGLDEGPGPLKEPVRLLCDARLLSEPLWYDCKLLMEPLRKSNKDRHATGMLKFPHGVIYIKSEVNRKWFMQTTNFTKGQLFLRKYILNKENNTLYIQLFSTHICEINKTQQYPHLQRNCQAKHKLFFLWSNYDWSFENDFNPAMNVWPKSTYLKASDRSNSVWYMTLDLWGARVKSKEVLAESKYFHCKM